MDINAYQPSPQVLMLSNIFCEFFGKQPLYYSFDLGNRVIPVNLMNTLTDMYPHSDNKDYRRIAEKMATSHQVSQLVIVAEEALRCFPNLPYNSDECSGLIAGLCGGRTIGIIINGVLYRGIVLIAGVVWLDKLPQFCLDPDTDHWVSLSKIIGVKRNHILRERALLKNLFR